MTLNSHPFEKLSRLRARLLFVRRLERVLAYLERRFLRSLPSAQECRASQLTEDKAREEFGYTRDEVRRLKSRVQRELSKYSAAAVLILIFLLILISAPAQTPPVPVVTAPAAPPAPATAAITLAWDRSPSPDVTGYRIYYGVASGTYTNTVTVGNTTNASLSGLLVGQRYYFAATAFNDDGESLFSNEVTGQAGYDRIVTITSRRAVSPTGPWTNAAIVWRATNSPLPALYVDHKIETTNRLTWK
jgi:hypothetical protein